jgi:UDP-N-acetylglucosamine--dolichyl-phosphate N-acetylglucosaminephosphotransferase
MKLSLIYIIIVEAIIAFTIAFFFLKRYIHLAKSQGYTGKDVHKVNKPDVPEMGGFGVVFGFLFGVAFAFPFFAEFHYSLLAAILTVIVAAFIGLFDDLFSLKPINKVILLFISAIPLVITRLGDSSITIPGIGQLNMGILYTIIFVPLFVNVFANMTNFLAGYNGLESGLGIITIFYFILAAILSKNIFILILLVPFLFALIAFYLFNRYPSKVFPGDITTLSIGAIIASAAIIGKAELFAILLCLLYLINFGLYFIFTFFIKPFTKLQETHISHVNSKGILERQYFKGTKKMQWQKIYYLFEHWFYPCTERKLVTIFLIIQFIINAIVLLIWFA